LFLFYQTTIEVVLREIIIKGIFFSLELLLCDMNRRELTKGYSNTNLSHELDIEVII